MAFYNLKSSDGQWAITKFDNDLNVESSYITSELECSCPAGSRPSCRHRQMLPKMLHVGAEDSAMFYDFDHDQFLEPITDEAEEDTQPAIVSPIEDELPPQAAQDMLYEGERVGPSTLAVDDYSSPSASGRGQPSPHPAITGTLKRRI